MHASMQQKLEGFVRRKRERERNQADANVIVCNMRQLCMMRQLGDVCTYV